jgi:hypothetical protein
VYTFGGRLRPWSYTRVKETYRSRFAIETSYRQMHSARTRPCTRDPLLRLLYVGIELILRNVWVWLHWQVLAERKRGYRRVDLGRMSFRAWFKLGRIRVTQSDWRAGSVSPLFSLSNLHLCQQGADAPIAFWRTEDYKLTMVTWAWNESYL